MENRIIKTYEVKSEDVGYIFGLDCCKSVVKTASGGVRYNIEERQGGEYFSIRPGELLCQREDGSWLRMSKAEYEDYEKVMKMKLL
jgi:hypothetical protein